MSFLFLLGRVSVVLPPGHCEAGQEGPDAADGSREKRYGDEAPPRVGMARGAPSPADLRVIRELVAREVVVTASQLESWRRAGLLPRHRRRGLGRGRGSVVDAVDPVVRGGIVG
ncbi:hypothetical protein [Streptomyces fradiae]|uniref:hypothetical protein n=1 Tax=Streptomyces fradiae TaxID=1906 RepID=UPI0029425D6D|nr:hypothetical protein [Streptomyces fradiae]WOI60908.1 hypothetical protein RYQ63_13925 [Streptomyces fradiae]